MAASDLHEQRDEEPYGALGGDVDALPSADELKSILQHITSLISDADRRHAHALGELQQRLESLGLEARSVRQQVPDEYQPAFERIEDGLDQIATRISRTEQERKTAKAASSDPYAVSADVLPFSGHTHPHAHLPQTQASDPHEAPDGEGEHDAAPAPLRSAMSYAHGSTGHGTPPPVLRGSHRQETHWTQSTQAAVDPFDIVESTRPGDADEPWDRDSAEALSRVYDDIGLSTPPAAAQVAHAVKHAPAPQSITPAAHHASASVPDATGISRPASAARSQSPAFDVGKDWLEARFAEIASRVEQSLADLRSETPTSDLDSKIDQLESRFGMVLEGVATRTDIENLREVETHLDALASHVEQTQLQLQRLDTIEAQLNAVMEKLSDQRLSSILEQTAPQPANIDPDAIATAAAEQVAQRLASIKPAANASSADTRRLDELREMLNGFILERRQGEEQTAGMLDTMQQAMIRLLDRVDALEYAPHAEPEPHHEEPVRPSQHYAAEPEHSPQPAPVAATERLEVPSPAAAEARPQVKASEVTREQLIAEARRAMQLAAAKREAEAQMQAEEEAKKGKSAKGRVEGMVGGLTKNTRRVMVGACTLLLLSSAVLLLMPRKGGTNIPEPKSAQTNTPAKPVDKSAERAAPTPSPAPAKATTAPSEPPSVKSAQGQGAAKGGSQGQGAATAPQQGVPNGFMPRTVPETAIDELSAPGPQLSEDKAIIQEAGMPPAAFPGITLHRNPEIGPQEAMRLRERQRMADLNARIGAAQIAAQQEGAVKISTDAVAVPAPAAQAAAPAEADSGAKTTAPMEMPPLAVGPTSLRQAAAKGDPSAEFEVAARLAEGRGIQQDFPSAIRWYQRAAGQGFAQAQYRLGTLYERGLGVKADHARARVWYQRAALQGNVKAMHNLAVLSAGRDTANPDYATASQWFKTAAEHGLTDSQFNLAVLYESGLGVQRDMTQAYKWLSIASKGGDKEAARRLGPVRNKLSNAEITAAEAEVQAFEAKPQDRIANDPIAAGEAWKTRTPSEATTG